MPAAPPGIARSSRYFPELESLRGIAILLVYAFHVDAFVLVPHVPIQMTVSAPLAFVRAGYAAVDLFFVLSAFLLARPFLAAVREGRPIVWRDYFRRRALRILPLYWIAVAIGTIATAGRPGDLVRAVPHLLFLTPFPGRATPLPLYSDVWWSLSTEVQFYLLLAFLPVALRSRRGRRIGLGVLAVWAVAYAAFARDGLGLTRPDFRLTLGYSVFGRAPFFLLGILAADVHLRHGESIRRALARAPWMRNGGADAGLFLAIVALAFLFRRVLFLGTIHMELRSPAWHLVEACLWTAVLLILLLAPLRTKPLFSNPALARLGVLSYSVYLIHVPLMSQLIFAFRHATPRLPPGWTPAVALTVAAGTFACLVLAMLTYRFVERPFLLRKEKLGA